MSLKVINFDDCPKTDNPIIRGECSGCEYYNGFEMVNGHPCIKCSY